MIFQKNLEHSKWMKENNPMKGKHHSDKTRIKMSTTRQGMYAGKKNPMFRISLCGKLNGMFGKQHTEETKEKIRLAKLGKKVPANSGKNSHFYGKTPEHTKRVKYKNIKMRSSWEAKYAQYLDEKNIKWIYEPKAFDLIVDNTETTYTPDFYLPDLNCYIEIKGWWRKVAKIKFKLFKKLYPNIKIEILEKKQLKKLKII